MESLIYEQIVIHEKTSGGRLRNRSVWFTFRPRPELHQGVNFRFRNRVTAESHT